jgi:hypothetical protein
VRVALLVALCGCNRILGLGDVLARDAAPPDGPFACPAIGITPPFSTLIHQALDQNCPDYVRVSSGLAIGTCTTDVGPIPVVIMQGTGDGLLEPVPELAGIPGEYYDHARPAPDGSSLVVLHYTSPASRVEEWVRTASGWSFGQLIPISNAGGAHLGPLGSDGNGGWRMLVRDTVGFEEWGRGPTGAWTPIATFDPTALGLADVDYGALAESGLRAVLIGTSQAGIAGVYYTDRGSVDGAFRIADRLDVVPITATPYLDATCARIYVSGLDAVFYAQHQ